MKIEEIWNQYETYTKEQTKQLRRLAFTGVAICWAFKIEIARNSSIQIPYHLIWAMVFLVLFFLFDIIQYVTGAALNRYWALRFEKEEYVKGLEKNTEHEKPRWVDYPAAAFFLLKVISSLIAFIFIGYYFISLLM